ncbi:MAG: MiaB/RimO family radical SAM methylthiotransferase [Alphaproteobacteria bacterium]|nr:MiaB/RimO family radical SAM methylthiotransferase [Alphaproteobacteria bacterium]
MSIKTVSFGCRLNTLENEKIASMLADSINSAIIVNTCSVTAEAERQSAQMVRKLSRKNPNVVIFVTGCGATRNSDLFSRIDNVIVIDNFHKLDKKTYLTQLKNIDMCGNNCQIYGIDEQKNKLSKQYIQVQNGCNHNCTYCVTRLLRGKSVSFDYDEILYYAKQAVKNGFYEIVLTGVDTASYFTQINGKNIFLADLCKKLLDDVPEIRHLRLSSVDPASREVPKIIELMKQDNRLMPHLHLSMQSGSDTILKSMLRRHDSEMLRNIIRLADGKVSFSADIICGFPGETEELFSETTVLVKELNLIHIHAFPFSPRPDTSAFSMKNQINREISKKRVKIINNIANMNKQEFMSKQIGNTVSVLVEENNIGRTPDDIDIFINNAELPNKTICNVKIIDIKDGMFVGQKIG